MRMHHNTDLKVRVGDIISMFRNGTIEIKRGFNVINSIINNYQRNDYVFRMNSEIIARFIAQGCGFSIRKLSEDKNCIAFEFMEKRQVDNLPGNF